MGIWMKDSSGTQSASLTMCAVGFALVSLWLLVSIVAKIGHIEIREFDAGQAMGYLTPLLALYFGRRWTDGKNTLDVDPNQPQVSVAVAVDTTKDGTASAKA